MTYQEYVQRRRHTWPLRLCRFGDPSKASENCIAAIFFPCALYKSYQKHRFSWQIWLFQKMPIIDSRNYFGGHPLHPPSCFLLQASIGFGKQQPGAGQLEPHISFFLARNTHNVVQLFLYINYGSTYFSYIPLGAQQPLPWGRPVPHPGTLTLYVTKSWTFFKYKYFCTFHVYCDLHALNLLITWRQAHVVIRTGLRTGTYLDHLRLKNKNKFCF